MMKYFVILVSLILFGCQTYHFSNEQAELSFAHLKDIELRVNKVEVIQQFQSESLEASENQAYRLKETSRTTVENLIRSKIIPTLHTQSQDELKFYIIDAAIKESKAKDYLIFEGNLKIHVEVNSETQRLTSSKDFDLYTIKERSLDLTLGEKEQVIFELNEALMEQFYTNFLKYRETHLTLL